MMKFKKLTPDEVLAARKALGLTQQGLADVLLLESKQSKDTVRSWEKGRRPCGGPESIALTLMVKLYGKKPEKA
jgi:DNA-binding transcriptional regulator YiaG